jgi:hypothetical protein
VRDSFGTPGWRPAAVVLAAVVVLALGAAAAAYAALNTSRPKARVLTTTVAQALPPAPATPPAAATPPLTPTAKAALPPAVTAKPPRIPLTATTPTTSATTTPSTGTKSTTTTTPSNSSGGAGEGPQPSALVLDTNAAATYNPYKLPGVFGDPALAIDGDSSTGWTAEVEPATAPKMAAGLLLDLKAPQRLSAITLITTTPGMTIQLYGAKVTTPPSSITDPAWVQLSRSTVVHKRHTRLTLRESKQAFQYVTLWISRAPASAVGTSQTPGRVTVNEIELLPA